MNVPYRPATVVVPHPVPKVGGFSVLFTALGLGMGLMLGALVFGTTASAPVTVPAPVAQQANADPMLTVVAIALATDTPAPTATPWPTARPTVAAVTDVDRFGWCDLANQQPGSYCVIQPTPVQPTPVLRCDAVYIPSGEVCQWPGERDVTSGEGAVE